MQVLGGGRWHSKKRWYKQPRHSRQWLTTANQKPVNVQFNLARPLSRKQVRRRKKILVHCRLGTSTSAAVITAYRLLKHGVGVRNTLSDISRARGDSMDLSPSMAAGLQQLQVGSLIITPRK